ncbi:MAG TPA: malto-oligosyltrehalose synthase [Pirellulales bacterium]|nr:malto-oligosyltrehalose synthase [Pirellulales bacterium]
MSSAHRNIPSSTYRLQLSGQLRFDGVAGLSDYLAELGIGAAYLSPFFRARHGSAHGYDVVDHRMPDPELGTEDDFVRMAETLRERGMGLMVDIVPNHMGIDDENNVWWQDVLEHGPSSSYAKYFDIDWRPPKEALRGRVLLPVLGDQFGKVLEEQQLTLAYHDQRLVIRYYERSFPTDPQTWVPILRLVLDFISEELGPDVPERMEFESIITGLEHLPKRSARSAEDFQERHRESEVARRRLWTLLGASPPIAGALERAIVEYNGQRGEPASFDRLEAFINDQPYRLCYWRVATDEINYRRFFDVDALAAIRVEDPEVFDAVHETVLRFIASGWVTALRIDHADGLFDPQQYLTNLADAVERATAAGGQDQAQRHGHKLYTLVEKILAYDENLPSDWPVDGTTGYDFLNLLNGIFVDRLGAYALRDIYARFTEIHETFRDVLHESKRTILASSLSSELYMLAQQLDRISEQHRWSRDFTRASLFRALREVVAYFPVYRTYIRPEQNELREEDRRRIVEAIRAAKRGNPAMSPTFFDFTASVLLLEDPEGLSQADRDERHRFIRRFQQFTGPVTAKGLEDTSFYRYFPLASLNEVGGEPSVPGISVELFHRRIQEQSSSWPRTMLSTGTHDTKRGEDLRARLDVLSETPETWDAAIRRWHGLNAQARTELDGAAVPDANEEYLIYQTLLGTWPLRPLAEPARQEYVERIVGYLDKALREAKLHTSWLAPYEEYDQAVVNFIRAILGAFDTPFVEEMSAFARSVADAGFVNALAQTLVKSCAPGVPDFYRGVEFWDFNLVDPDNRRSVDFDARRQALACLRKRADHNLGELAAELLRAWPDERIKLFTIWRALTLRAASRALCEGLYQPLFAEGPRKGNLCAFARVADNEWAICLVPRLVYQATRECEAPPGGSWRLADWWQGTDLELPPEAPASWRHVLTGQTYETTSAGEDRHRLDVASVFRSFPVALLIGAPA